MKLNVATGIAEYEINNGFVLRFNPTDPAFIEKLYCAFTTLEEKDNEFHKLAKAKKASEVFEIARKTDQEMRDVIDGVLGDGTCTGVFGSLNVYAHADGFPIWANLLLAIIDEMDDAFTREQKASNPRLKKYTEKFEKSRALLGEK